ncbi:MAG: type II toxin-antitoxin system HipA family toxin [Gammaproteobacteria bacterium]|jgi:serine/threonine-protein kinase HipA|nr:type II toxin-antitoxin system HipA family toxin [Gammaproteobacteria bacterium]MBP6051180.1 type II toxin-antitoxin system HipA family toxin [Pseudomonadales bacterium]MBK7520468.1 type II toxin-antitoxin system HipA family toxin [Gammaproteobacteria bacterium]MBK7728046.1 type II toxin-antitoxin system HipA family toxin [Gammaproteobacteria bacterium]MBK8308909.1 type II toxin-antitoxin system HipA family toxin [Gammaproteobacteria bacterium]
MLDPDELHVWHRDQLVGFLWRDADDRIGFRYDADWVRNGFRLSVQLPLTTAAFEPGDPRAPFFFRNLLPEGEARSRLLSLRRLPDSDFVLLREYGGDCAGAISILPGDMDPTSTARYAALSEEMLHQLVQDRGASAYAPTDRSPAVRLSLAGAQHKCPVFHEGGTYALPQGVAPSSHVLKFEVSDLRNVPLYECFLGRLARAAGLEVCESTIDQVRELRFLRITRYDRVRNSQELQRLHQEDFLQALGPTYRDKYESLGGPGARACAELIRTHCEDPVTDLQRLVQWQAFNVLAGNSDGHAKNLSLLQTGIEQDAWRLAPFYDLLCTRAFPRLDAALALSVGGEFTPGDVTPTHWARFARDCGFAGAGARRIVEDIRSLAERLPTLLDATRAAFEAEFGTAPALQQVEEVVRQQCRRHLALGD